MGDFKHNSLRHSVTSVITGQFPVRVSLRRVKDMAAKQPPEKPPVKTVMVKVPGIRDKRPWYVWRCNYRITQRKRCDMVMDQASRGVVDHNSEVHWKNHVAGLNGGEKC